MDDQNLYDTDFYSWSQQQSELLQDVRDNRLDTENLAEEVADLGRNQLRAVERHIELIFIHLIKLAISPADGPPNHWISEVRAHARQARRRFSPGMRQHIALADLWAEAIDEANDDLAGFGDPVVPRDLPCPFEFDDLVTPSFEPKAAMLAVQGNLPQDGD